MYVAPKSTEVSRAWGSYGTVRSTTSTTDGVANTTTLHSFGSAAHPAAYYCRALTTGGYNTWYLPAKDELMTCWTNRAATPFATDNAFSGAYNMTSTEFSSTAIWTQRLTGVGQQVTTYKKNTGMYLRAIRRSTI
jgi:hypothetical protein